MKILRRDNYPIVDAVIDSIELDEEGNAHVHMLTVSNQTPYTLVMSPLDMEEMRTLLSYNSQYRFSLTGGKT